MKVLASWGQDLVKMTPLRTVGSLRAGCVAALQGGIARSGTAGATMVGMIRHLVSNPCRDACGTIDTGERVDGAPILRCPGCDSTWVELEAPAAPGGDNDSGPEPGTP